MQIRGQVGHTKAGVLIPEIKIFNSWLEHGTSNDT